MNRGALHSRLFSINNNTLKGRNLDRGFCLVFSAARPITRPHFTAAQCDDSRADLRRTRMRVRVHAFSRIYILLRIEVGGVGGGEGRLSLGSPVAPVVFSEHKFRMLMRRGCREGK